MLLTKTSDLSFSIWFVVCPAVCTPGHPSCMCSWAPLLLICWGGSVSCLSSIQSFPGSLEIPSTCPTARKLSHVAVMWVSCRLILFFFFSSLRNHCPLLPNVYCMLQFVFIICWFYVGSWIFVCYTILVWSRKL